MKTVAIIGGALLLVLLLQRRAEAGETNDTDTKPPKDERPEDKTPDKPSSPGTTVLPGGGLLPDLLPDKTDREKALEIIKSTGLLDESDSIKRASGVRVDTKEPNPMEPTLAPIQGQYYRVKKGDNASKVCVSAGLPSKANLTMRDHPKNAWMPKTYSDGKPFPPNTGAALPFFAWFPAPGWAVPSMWKSGYQFPVVYVPTEAEHKAGRWAQ